MYIRIQGISKGQKCKGLLSKIMGYICESWSLESCERGEREGGEGREMT